MNSSRRAFLQSTTVLLAAGTPRPAFRYVTACDAIHVFSKQRGGWAKVQTVASRSPTALTWHQSGRVLYVANEIGIYKRLPRGTVEAYGVDSRDGLLNLLSRQPLSLSATRPRSLALSPDGRHLVVAAYGGGSYNVISLDPSGALVEIASIFKETGAGAHPKHQAAPHPHSAIFDPTGRYLLATDFGCDRINVFRLIDGALNCVSRLQTAAGAGPASLAVDASGTLLRVQHELSASVCCYRFDLTTGRIDRSVT